MISLVLGLAACAPHIDPGPIRAELSREPVAIIASPNTSSPNIYLTATMGAGSAYDPSGEDGIAHMVAQALVEGGAGSRSAQDIKNALEPSGGELQVFVDREWVSLRLRCHVDHAALCTEIFTDTLSQPAFDGEAVTRLREQSLYAVTEGVLSSEEGLGAMAFEVWTYEGHPYGHPIQGRAGTLPTLGNEQVQRFYDRHYVRSNTLVGIAGNFSEEHQALLATGLEGLRSTPAPELILPRVAPLTEHALLIVETESDLTGFHFGLPFGVDRTHPDWPALWVGFTALGAHRQSFGRLFETMRTQRGLNYGDYAYAEPFVQRGWSSMPEQGVLRRQQHYQFWIRPVSNENAAFSLKLALNELEAFIDKGLDEEEFARTKSYLLGNIPLMAQQPGRRLLFELDARAAGTPNIITELPSKLEALSLAEVNAAISRHIQSNNLRIVAVSGDSKKLLNQLTEEMTTAIVYSDVQPDALLKQQDAAIAKKDLKIPKSQSKLVKAAGLFQ
jgi:zinc protease